MAKNKARDAKIKKFYNAIDVDRPIHFDHLKVENGLDEHVYVPDLHADSEDAMYLPRRALARALSNSNSADRYFFTGMRGAGKTTELLRLRQELEESGDFVVFYADLSEYLPLNTAVEIGDFLLTVLSALADCVQEDKRFGENFKSTSFMARLGNFLQSEVQIEGIDWAADTIIGKLGFKAKIKANPSFKQNLQKAASRVIDQLVEESRTFTNELVAYVRQRCCDENKKVVLLVDSVERLAGVGAERAKEVFDSVENLFGSHRDKLRFSMLNVVYSVPPYISAVAVAGGGNLVYALPHTHIFDRPTTTPHGTDCSWGFARVKQVIELRYPDYAEFFSDKLLERLNRDSGGDLRELFLLIRETLNLVDPDEDQHFPIPERFIAQAEKMRRSQFGIISGDEMDWLKRIVATHEIGLKSQAELATLARLWDGKLVFQYRNGDYWYDVHPLLWDKVDAHAASTEQ